MAGSAGGAGHVRGCPVIGLRPVRIVLWAAVVGVCGASCSGSAEPELVERLEIQPDSVYLTIGESASFSATPISEEGRRLVDRSSRVSWTVQDSNVEGMTEAGVLTLTARSLGSTRVTAHLADVTELAEVHVQPDGLARVGIFEGETELPDVVTYTDLPGRDYRADVVVRLFDASGQEMSPAGFRVSWLSSDNRAIVVNTNPNSTSARLFLQSGSSNSLVQVLVGDVRRAIQVNKIDGAFQ